MGNEYKNRSIFQSFREAARGLWFCIKSERNMRIHTTAAAYVLFFAALLNLSRGEYAILLAVIAAMITSEAFNTSLEKLCDFTCNEHDRRIGIIKDISAGAVFISAVFAVGIGVLIMWKPPELVAILTLIGKNPLCLWALAVSILFALIYIFAGPVGIKRTTLRWLRKTGFMKKTRQNKR